MPAVILSTPTVILSGAKDQVGVCHSHLILRFAQNDSRVGALGNFFTDSQMTGWEACAQKDSIGTAGKNYNRLYSRSRNPEPRNSELETRNSELGTRP
jgi:hypothetical protein